MTPAEIQRELEELDTRLERLRIKYDQYFTGTEKMLPFVQRKDVDRRFHALHREQMRNTGLRFRFQTLVQRFTMYQAYWGRIIRQIEEGTFRRDVMRAQRLGLRNPDLPPRATEDGPQELSADELEEIEPMEPEPDTATPAPSMRPPSLEEPAPVRPRPAAPRLDDASEPAVAKPAPFRDTGTLSVPPRALTAFPRPATSTPAPAPLAAQGTPTDNTPAKAAPIAAAPKPTVPVAPPKPAGPVGLPRGASVAPPASRPSLPSPATRSTPPGDESSMRQLFDRYIAARKQTGESVDVRYETVAKQVQDTLPRLAEKYQDAEVRLDVTIKDGKAILRPVVTVKKKP